jgi:hypothetical protein
MLIEACDSVHLNNLIQYAWFGLRRFQNVDYVAELIRARTGAPAAQRANIRKQATQIRYCLVQAKEYCDAAATVSLATKPNLLYYSIMSLALAEILFKQDGLSSWTEREKSINTMGSSCG